MIYAVCPCFTKDNHSTQVANHYYFQKKWNADNFGIGSKALFTITSDENAMIPENKEAEIIGLGISAILIEYLDRNNVRRKMTKPYESLRRE